MRNFSQSVSKHNYHWSRLRLYLRPHCHYNKQQTLAYIITREQYFCYYVLLFSNMDFASMQTVYFVKSGSVSWEGEWDEGGVEGLQRLGALCWDWKGKNEESRDGSLLSIETAAAAAAAAVYSCTQQKANSYSVCQFAPLEHLFPTSAPNFIVSDWMSFNTITRETLLHIMAAQWICLSSINSILHDWQLSWDFQN